MNCEKCGTERALLRDDDDNLYRRICPCEINATCHGCARGKVVAALLDRAGDVAKYSCAKHGSEDIRTWVTLAEMPRDKPKKEEKGEKKEKEVRAAHRVKAPDSPNDVKKSDLPLYEGICCVRPIVSVTSQFPCPKCGKTVSGARLEGGTMDGFYLNHGNGITSVIVCMKIYGHGEYDAKNLVLSVS